MGAIHEYNDPRYWMLCQDLLARIRQMQGISQLAGVIKNFNDVAPFDIQHMGIHRLGKKTDREFLFSLEDPTSGWRLDSLPKDIAHLIATESDHFDQPIDLCTYKFSTLTKQKTDSLRDIFERHGVKQLVLLPFKIRSANAKMFLNVPQGSFFEKSDAILPLTYQIWMALIDQFPYVFQRADDLKLSKREAEVIGLTATGLRELEIAEQLGISEHTVRNHIENSKRKLNARNKSHAVSIAITTKEIVGG